MYIALSQQTRIGFVWCRSVFLADRYTQTHTCLMALCPGLPRWASTREVKPIWILLKQETVSGSGISWTMCKSAPHFRQHPTTWFFTGRMPFLVPKKRQSTEGSRYIRKNYTVEVYIKNSLKPCSAQCNDIVVVARGARLHGRTTLVAKLLVNLCN